MPNRQKPSHLKLVPTNNASKNQRYETAVIAIMPLEKGVYAWIVEDPAPLRPFRF